MKGYNLYYKSRLINRKPVTAEFISDLRKKPTITKVDKNKNQIIIPTGQIKVVECYTV